MSSASKKKLLQLVRESLPLDQAQKKAAEEGIEQLSDNEAIDIADDLQNALDTLPNTLIRLESLLAKQEMNETVIQKDTDEKDVAIVLEEDETFGGTIEEILFSIAYVVRRVRRSSEVWSNIQTLSHSAIIFADVNMPSIDGFELLRQIKEKVPDINLVAITDPSKLARTAVKCKELGAKLLTKPLPREALEIELQQITELASARREVERLRFGTLIGSSKAVKEIFRVVEKAVTTEAPLLIIGEPGTGKELVAREIHRRSKRGNRPFLAINCAAYPEHLLDSELFGHVRDAFTGATTERHSIFKSAAGGTVFLDEINELSTALQEKLLLALHDKTVVRLEGSDFENADVRVIVATNNDLEAQVQANRFNRELFYRLSACRLNVPPLREREGDFALLAQYFLKRIAARHEREFHGFSQKAFGLMQQYSWPGNIRELQNQIERAVISAKGPLIDESDLDLSEIQMNVLPLEEAQQNFKREYIMKVLSMKNNDPLRASQALGLKPRALDKLLEKIGRSGKLE